MMKGKTEIRGKDKKKESREKEKKLINIIFYERKELWYAFGGPHGPMTFWVRARS